MGAKGIWEISESEEELGRGKLARLVLGVRKAVIVVLVPVCDQSALL